MTVRVVLLADAKADIENLPVVMRSRLDGIIERLHAWPNVSGAKAMKHEWKGHHRIRMGDWRVLFKFVAPDVIVVRVRHRRDVYED
jgi:mRNA-degrading endonuclease RelE of RelBE toxin-antitoxin system